MSERLEEIRERLVFATKGPWIADRDLAEYDAGLHNVWEGIEGGYKAVAHDIFAFADAEFIANAREDIPWLLDALEAAEADAQTAANGWKYESDARVAAEQRAEAAEADARQKERALEAISALLPDGQHPGVREFESRITAAQVIARDALGDDDPGNVELCYAEAAALGRA